MNINRCALVDVKKNSNVVVGVKKKILAHN